MCNAARIAKKMQSGRAHFSGEIRQAGPDLSVCVHRRGQGASSAVNRCDCGVAASETRPAGGLPAGLKTRPTGGSLKHVEHPAEFDGEAAVRTETCRPEPVREVVEGMRI